MKQRMMARPAGQASSPGTSRSARTGLVLVVGAALILGALAFSGVFRDGSPGATTPLGTAVAGVQTHGVSGAPQRTNQPSPRHTAEPTRRPTGTPPDEPTPRPTASPPDATATPTLTPGGAGGAPTKPQDFDLEGQAIDMAFPLRRDTRYRYRDNFLDLRTGLPGDYNHARIGKDGTLQRLHDGIDIYARLGEPLVAPFTGTIIDPSQRWRPWERERYGKTIVVLSEERGTEGYMAMFVHCAEVWVAVGDRVTRGQIVGTLGKSGNAEDQSVEAHLHFELRAPFLLDWSGFGEDRAIDAFNPYPSLVAADPKRT